MARDVICQKSMFLSPDQEVAMRWLRFKVFFHRGDFEYGVMRKGACNLDHPNWGQSRANAVWVSLLMEGLIIGPDPMGCYRLKERV